ncbi:MAG: helicase domain protein [Myxococcaceae bacterium]|nr:helicase domain protein [Myxococcaceae bacterium]
MRSRQAMTGQIEQPGSGTESRLCALLGPTNTGKTHRAIERMLDFDSGVMGLPLRLLAREVYDRVSTRVGEQAVALVTGEEKRVPQRPRYWICTTEAMPRDLRADFVAVDEIQLMGHPERGHVFTDRLLHARGRLETWFLGSGTAESLVRTHLPGLRVQKLPRLSRLLHTGQSSLRTLPRRSAVVAFSMTEVYELADALRRRRGGAAVVLGALSPRVRNAQVALYQAGEVDFLVATDAIGMGLNLDIHHVALAGTVKFDGFETRSLESSELAQIAGRAGRHLRDGTFGTLAPEPELPRGVVEQLEQHRFPAQRFAYYRNSELEFDSIAALLASLGRRPQDDTLRSAPEGDDVQVLRALAKRPEVSQSADEPARLRALWDVCRVPNYEKRIPEHQAEQMLPLYLQLIEDGHVSADFVEQRVRGLSRYEGDMHALMDRLSAVRTWTYVTHQSGWLERASELQARTRDVEDKLSDALHERLLERFVEPAERRRSRMSQAASAQPRASESHHPFASLSNLTLPGEESDPVRTRAQWVQALVDARFEELTLDATGALAFRDQRVARLARGQHLSRPKLKLLLPASVEPGASARIERRLTAHLRDVLAYLLEPLVLGVVDSAPLRGLTYQLEQGLGTTARREALPQLQALSELDRRLLEQHEVSVGRVSVYSTPMLSYARLGIREALCKCWAGPDDAIAKLSTEALFQAAPAQLDRQLALALGFLVTPHWVVRCDVVERLLSLEPAQALEEAQLMLGAGEADARAILLELPRGRKRRRRR